MTDSDTTAEATDVVDPAVSEDATDDATSVMDDAQDPAVSQPSEDVGEQPAVDDAPSHEVVDSAGDDVAADDVVGAVEDDAPAPVDDEEFAADDAEEAPADDSDDLDALLGLAGADDDTPADDQTAAAPDEDGDSDADDTTTAEDGDDEPAEEPVVRRRPESMADVRDRRDLIRLPGDWYVVHTYSGYEQRVKDNLTNRIEALAAEDRIYELVIPTEEVTEFKKGKKQTSEKKFLPGYVLIRMDLDDETWNIVRHTPAVTGFVGATASKPVPLSLREVAATLKIPDRLDEESEGDETEEETAKSQVAEIDLEVGETIRVTSGPFADFTGTIAEINLDQAKLRVMVSVFGRETPLEMPFDQVAKIT